MDFVVPGSGIHLPDAAPTTAMTPRSGLRVGNAAWRPILWSVSWVAIDTETTGLEPGSRLVELAAVRFELDGRVRDRFATMVDPGIPMPADAGAITGIDDAMLAGAPAAPTVLREFLAWLGDDAPIAAHNAGFDRNLLGWECDRAGMNLPRWRMVDTVIMAKSLGTPGGLSLAAQVAHHGWELPGHRAEPDAEATMRLVLEGQRQLKPARFAAIAQGRRDRGRWRHAAALPGELARLPELVDRGGRLRFTYTDRAGRRSQREITPYGYALARGKLRFHGWCHLRGERRNFAFERCAFGEPAAAA